MILPAATIEDMGTPERYEYPRVKVWNDTSRHWNERGGLDRAAMGMRQVEGTEAVCYGK